MSPSNPPDRRRSAVGALALGWLVACLWVGGCGTGGEESTGESESARLNVLLIVVDTLGAENVGVLVGKGVGKGAGEGGSSGAASPTPALDRLAAESVVFQRAYSPAPWTQPAVASLLTSQMPSSHGVVSLFNVLGDRHQTLPERLTLDGYRTGAVVSHRLVGAEFGFDQGLDHFDQSLAGGHQTVTSPQVTERALEWLDSAGESRRQPFFLLAHYFDPHYIYRHHRAFDRTSGYQGSLRPGQPIWGLRDQASSLDDQDAAYLTGLYREEIAFTDQAIGRLLDGLAERGLTDDTLIVVVADHGEEILRRGWIGHTRTLYDELLRVPWILRLPHGRGAGVYDSPVSLLDVMPTVLALLGLPVTPDLEGRSLAGWIEQRDLVPPVPVLAEVSFDDRAFEPDRVGRKTAFKTAAVDGDLKVIHDLVTDSWELYDLASDPQETHNLAATDHPEEPRLRRLLLRWEQERDAGGKEKARPLRPSDETLDELRSLGYLR